MPDKNGETRDQGPVYVLGIDLLKTGSRIIEIWELDKNLVNGRLPKTFNEALIGQKLADN